MKQREMTSADLALCLASLYPWGEGATLTDDDKHIVLQHHFVSPQECYTVTVHIPADCLSVLETAEAMQ